MAALLTLVNGAVNAGAQTARATRHAGGANASSPVGPSRTVTHTAHGYITTITEPNGDSTKVYAASPVTITASTTRTTTVHRADGTTRTLHGAGGKITPVWNGKKLVRPSTITAYEELRAMGVSAADAAYVKRADDRLSGPLRGATATASSTPITQPACVNRSYDSNMLHLSGCDSTYQVGSSGAVWYPEDRYEASATMHDYATINPDEVTGLKFGDQYGGGNSIYTWNPNSTRDMGSCTTVTVSIAYKGVGISASQPECPETFGLYYKSQYTFESKWDGQGSGPSNGSRAAEGVDGVYNGASANPYPGILYYVWWE